MTRLMIALTVALLCAAAMTTAAPASSSQDELVSISDATVDALKSAGARCSIETAGGDAALLRIAADGSDRCEVSFVCASGEWNLSARQSINLEVHNPGPVRLTVRVRVENPDAQGLTRSCQGAVALAPGEKRELVVRLMRTPQDPGYDVFKPFMMYFKNINVRDNTIDPAHVARLVIGVDPASPRSVVQVGAIRAAGSGSSETVSFFPFVDRYGQYMHSDWPGKIYTDGDFAAHREEEAKERAQWSAPKDWDRFGGWNAGPSLKATGFFYPTKHEGKWWLVDPDGRLFWSYGPTGVGFGGDVSPITDRENWFAYLPPRDSEFGRLYRNGHGALYRYYQNRDWVGFDFQRANLMRKYGAEYEQQVAELSHERLRSWGFNSLGNWSDSRIYLMHRTPYVVAIHYDSVLIHARMPDVYHPDWEKSVRARMERERDRSAGDPWNIGYFVDNERWWGWRPRAAAVGEETLKNPAERHAKIKLIEQLKSKYNSIESLNMAWGTSHASWEALAESRTAPDMKNSAVLSDCGDFGMAFAERYFTVCRDAVKSVAPNNLYLGPRFNGHIDPELMKLAAKYCDVISYNIYDNPPDKRVDQYRSLDLPIMCTEWGIGSDPQQTPFRGEQLKVPTPIERAREMASYARHAIVHPNIVGAHFFQFRDQPLSGRPDGEGTLRGFVNIADTPNFALIEANRAVASELYQKRAASSGAASSESSSPPASTSPSQAP